MSVTLKFFMQNDGESVNVILLYYTATKLATFLPHIELYDCSPVSVVIK